ncbi:MAG: leucyl aminopeptidase family protein [Phycisphaerales bacterium JB059]
MFSSISVSARASVQALVVGQFKGQKLDPATLKLDPDGSVKRAAQRSEATGEAGSIVMAYPAKGYERVLILGLGDKESFETGSLRRSGGLIGRALAAAKVTGVEIALDGALGTIKKAVDEEAAGQAMGEGLGLIGWVCDDFRGSATGNGKNPGKLSVKASDRDFAAGLKRGLGLAEGSNLARTLSQTPPNIATTTFMAKECQKLARRFDTLSCRVIKGEQLVKEKLQGLINVGKASVHPPCLIRLEYTPKTVARGAKPVVFVGKTMTYDSGGLSIKVGGGMRGMKRDKDGGCAVIGAMHAIASVVKPKQKVVALLMCAENSISDEAYRPDDVITFRNGVTVEVTNTDAEGRLVLADGLCWACDKEKPGCIVDVATLTGGIVVALGSTYAGMWCDDDDLRAKVQAASDRSGERVWRMPHHPEYRDLMKSPVADIVNSAPVRAAHPIQGAAFLSHFVKEGTPWAHLDIAGTHAVDKDSGEYIAGPTGFGARLLAELVAG